MKKIFSIFLVFCISITAFSQINTGILPPSLQKNCRLPKNFQHVEVTPPNLTKMAIEDQTAAKNGTFLPISKLMPVNLTPKTAGTWSVNSDGRHVWRLSLSSNGAKGSLLFFNQFALPKGSQLFAYNPDGSVILGPYTHEDNPEGLLFTIGMIYGNEAILEYVAPYSKTIEGGVQRIEPQLEIGDFGYVYRDIIDLRNTNDFRESESCQVNVNCSEGDNWRTQQKGVARILVVEGRDAGWCSGTLINNTRNDQTPYFLTADHCGGEKGNFKLWQFYFNYEAPGCDEPDKDPKKQATIVTGCQRIARQPLNNGSDFLLLKLNTTAEKIAKFGGAFNGWNLSTTGSESGVSIHHPAGDIKKISTYTKPLTTTTYWDDEGRAITNAHWKVYWSATANGHGTTEGGSSGSPIFNKQGFVVGTLSGGTSGCDYTTGYDMYGKMSVHWATGIVDTTQLKPWLDPDNTGVTTCDPLDINSHITVSTNNLSFDKEADTKTVTVTSDRNQSANWTAETTENWITIAPTTGNGSGAITTMTVSVIANPNETKRTGSIVLTQGTQTCTITVTQKGQLGYGFSYNFEDCTSFAVDQFDPCTTYDGDGQETGTIDGVTHPNQYYVGAFIAFAPTETSPAITGLKANSGSKCGACFFNLSQKSNNDWFITPKIKLGTDSKFKFAARSYVTKYGDEEFNVLVSETDNNPSSFTKINTIPITATDAWKDYEYDINSWNGKEVYLAIQCVSTDQFFFVIDDIEVTTEAPTGVKNTLSEKNWSVYAQNGNLVFESKKAANIEIFNLLGQKIHSQKVEQGTNIISNLPTSQIYIVRCNNVSERIIIK